MLTIRSNYEDEILKSIKEVLSYNASNENKINLTQIQISKGLYNRLKSEKTCLQSKDFLIDGVSYELIDNCDFGCFLHIRFN